MSEQGCPRRALMLGAGLTGLTVLLAACDGGGEQPAASKASATGGPGGDPGSGRLVKVGDVPVGGGVVSQDGVLVLQLSAGKFTAFDAICPHQNFRVSPPDAQGIITCRGHDSHFQAADGARIDGPSPSGLRSVPVQVKEGYVVKA